MAAKEELRQVKATAIQDARRQKNQKRLANRLLKRVVKANFNLTNVMSAKVQKKIDDNLKQKIAKVRGDISSLEKLLQSIAFGAKVDENVDESKAEKLIDEAVAKAKNVDLIARTYLKIPTIFAILGGFCR